MWFLILLAIFAWYAGGLYLFYLLHRKRGTLATLTTIAHQKTLLLLGQLTIWPLWLLWLERPYLAAYGRGSLERLGGFWQFLRGIEWKFPWTR